MNKELAVTSQQFGLVAGIFFLGYFVFEIPSNLLMHRIGARIWIARILISWGRTQVQQFRHLPMWDKNCADGAETRQCLRTFTRLTTPTQSSPHRDAPAEIHGNPSPEARHQAAAS